MKSIKISGIRACALCLGRGVFQEHPVCATAGRRPALAGAAPDEGLDRIEKIRRGLSIKHGRGGELEVHIGEDAVVRGRIDSDCDLDGQVPLLIIDDRKITWDEFGRMWMAFEGFSIQVGDPRQEGGVMNARPMEIPRILAPHSLYCVAQAPSCREHARSLCPGRHWSSRTADSPRPHRGRPE
jgi:hypothetical protein